MTDWKKSDWRNKPRVQMPDYTETATLNAVEEKLSTYPPLVFAGEARRLRSHLADVSRGDAFLLQGAIAPKVSQLSTLTVFATHSK